MRPVCKRTGQSSHRSFAALLGATAVANLANGVGLLDETHALFWRGAAMVAELAQPAALLYVGLAFLRPAELERDTSALWRARIIGVVGLLLAVFAVTGQVFEWKVFEDGQTAMALASWGRLPYVFIVIGMALGLAQLELVLRASREPVRHKLKFVVIGLGGLAGYQIYQASQMLLFPVWQAEHVLVSSVAMIMALCSDRLRVGANQIAGSFCQHLCVTTGPLRLGDVHHHRALLAGGGCCRRMASANRSTSRGRAQCRRGIRSPGWAGDCGVFKNGARRAFDTFLRGIFIDRNTIIACKWLQVTEAFHQAASKEAIMDRLLDLLIKTFADHHDFHLVVSGSRSAVFPTPFNDH